ncbi:extracellular solute-binding protein [Halococcus saccharolyticus]|uniref:Maltose ABC transporter maltose-binding protein n=1 Tax=Halococcus saccharolyticus DSM 5350 TaxID=1227455 RepID=M0MBW0_9EURY|nr:extracellular solute-binding protein [Halococcus saccharolyticus]EMA43262.1 maltose ABC transporter maltose-binding protein [Halococcus saccharolyticus DSM 5350]
MSTDRRTLLKHIGGTSALLAIAGCISAQEQGSGGGSGNGDAQSGGNASSGNDANGSADGTAGNESGSTGPAGSAKAWYSLPKPEQPARKEAIKAFNAQSEHTIEGADISDMEKKTTSAIPAGQGPKTFEWAHDWVGDYFQRGFIVDGSDQLEVNLDTFTSAAAGAVQFEGNVVGLPHAAETVTLIYNTDVVDEAPKTMAEMVSTMKEHHDPGNDQYGLSYPFDPYFTSAWLQAFGGYYFDPEKDPMLGVNKQETVRGLEFALDKLKPYMPNDPKYEPQAAAFAAGNAAFAINGPWYLATLNEKGVNYEVTTLPKPDGGEPNPYTGITMWYFAKGMENDDPATEAARNFVEWYVTNEDQMLQLAKEQGTIPVLSSLVGSDDLPSEVKPFSEAVKGGTPMPTRPKMNKVWPAMETALIKAFNGDAAPQAALDAAAKTIRNNWE